MNTMEDCKSWSDMVKSIIDFPIKRFPDKAYTNDEVKQIVSTMRKRMDEAAKSPAAEDPFETRSADYKNMYDTFQHMADMRGIIFD